MTTVIRHKPSGRVRKATGTKASLLPKEQEYMMWDEIKRLYPDRFVLLENPVYEPNSPFLIKGIFRYKNKSKDKVADKAAELRLGHITIKYTGGPLEEKDYIFVF